MDCLQKADNAEGHGLRTGSTRKACSN